MDISKLIADSAGRGCWIGLFPETTDDAPPLPKVSGFRNEDPHLTLAHLGRDVHKMRIELADRAIAGLAIDEKPILSYVDGVARLEQKRSSALVLLMKGVDEIRQRLITRLENLDCYYDKKFGFKPHVTIAKDIHVDMEVSVPRVDAHMRFDRIGLVVGDNRIYYGLGNVAT